WTLSCASKVFSNSLFDSLSATCFNSCHGYYFLADLPAFLLNTSPSNLTPLPLYGSGLRKLRILAATCPISCLSIDSKVIVGALPFTEVVVTLISGGKTKTIGCEKPKASSKVFPVFDARKPTPTSSCVVLYPSVTPTTILFNSERYRPCNDLCFFCSVGRKSTIFPSSSLTVMSRSTA